MRPRGRVTTALRIIVCSGNQVGLLGCGDVDLGSSRLWGGAHVAKARDGPSGASTKALRPVALRRRFSKKKKRNPRNFEEMLV